MTTKQLFNGAMAIVVAIAALFLACQKEPAMNDGNIVVYVESLEAQPEGEALHFNYTIQKPVEGQTLAVKCNDEWVSDIKVLASFVEFKVAKNSTGNERSTTLELSYGSSHKSLKVTQKPFLEPLSLKIDSYDATSVTFSVVALDDQTTWIGQIVGKEWFESYDEEQILSEDIAYYHSMADDAGVEFEEFLASILSRGSRSGIRMGGLDVESEYVVYVYGMNALGEKTTSLYSKYFTTTAPYEGNDVTYDINIDLNRALANITITPSHEGVAYYNNITTREHFERCGSDINALAKDVVAQALENYRYWEYTDEEFFRYNTEYRASSYEFEGTANTEYVVFAFKWDEKLEPLSEISYEWFKVEAIPDSENQLSMSVSDVTQTTFYIETTTTNNDPYTIFAVSTSELGKNTTDAEIFRYLMNTYGAAELKTNQCQGDVAGTFSGLSSDTEYYVLLFGYEAGTRTTAMIREKIKTLAAGDVEACKYTVEVSEIGDREAKIEITPSDYSVWYYWNVFDKSMTEEQMKDYILDLYNSYYYADYWEFSYYELSQGVSSSYISQLRPSTEYNVVIVPMNPNDFEYKGSMRVIGEFTTTEAVIADITITAGFDAYYDGDEVYALEPGNLSSFQGYAILPMSVSIEGEYSRFLYTIFDYVEGLENPEVYSDDILLEPLYSVGAYWTPAYFRGEWEKDLMIAAVAFDMEGNPSRVYREKFYLTREGASPAQEFVDYFMSGSSASYSAVQSADRGSLVYTTNEFKAVAKMPAKSKNICKKGVNFTTK